jgi:RNA polymerase sigma-70 factor (ECF subfamily)
VPVGEIAEALAIPLNTAYSRLRLAREELAAAVETIAAREVHRA